MKGKKIQANQEFSESDEIDIIALAKTIWEGRRIVIINTIIFIFLGLFFALFSPKVFTSSTTIVPQVSDPTSKIGGLSSLASLAGFNLNMTTGSTELSPMLYPQIVGSTTFLLEIMNSTYSFEELDKEVTLYDYYLNYYKSGPVELLFKYTIGLPRTIINSLKGKNRNEVATINDSLDIIKISEDQDEVLEIMRKKLDLTVNDKEGYLMIISQFHQADLSAQIASKAVKLLQDRITMYKIEKAEAQASFIRERYEERKEEFEGAQYRLASFQDANKNISSATKATEEERLKNEYQLAFEVYSELAKQLEQAKIRVKEDTPVFAVIEEVTVPVEKSKPKRTLMLMVFMVFGVIIGFGIVYVRHYFTEIQNIWNEI